MIECRISKTEAQRLLDRNEVLFNVDVLKQLRAKGIPVRGSISVLGVPHGSLTTFEQGPDYVWQWAPGEAACDDLF